MTHSYMWHDSFICVTWLIHMCDMTHSYVWHDSFICVTWRIHMYDMTHSHVWNNSFICAPWLTHMCDTTHSHWWHIPCPMSCDTTHSYMCDMTLSHAWHIACTSHMRIIHVTRMNEKRQIHQPHKSIMSHSQTSQTAEFGSTSTCACHTRERVMSHSWTSHVIPTPNSRTT